MKVSQVLCAAGPVDAVTNQALRWRRVFEEWGWIGDDYAAYIAPGLPNGRLRAVRELRPAPDEIVLLHYSGYVRGLEELAERSPRTLLISHNVTPARYFWAHEPVTAAHCALAQVQLAELARGVTRLVGVSEFNAQDLRRLSGRAAAVIPILFDARRLPPPPHDAPLTGGPTILFVGRLTPHKRQDLVIRAFALYRRSQPEARLMLVGTPMNEEFGSQLRSLADELAPGGVTLRSGISPDQLADIYRAADVFLCLSEHEGFCIPLLEAFHYDLPVIARDSGAVAEVVGDAGILVSALDGISVIAELVRILVEDNELRAELRARGERRLGSFDPRRTVALLRETVEDLAAS
jgi:glycosyltransferase involved in cell wall biosynthesis